MPMPLTEKTFFQYLKCPHWVYFDAHDDEDNPHHPLMQKLQDTGLISKHHEALLETKDDVVRVTAEDQEEAYLETVEYMRQGHQTIYGGVLIDKHWIGHPDLLERVEGKSKFGDYYYIAADIKSARSVRDEFTFQGCFYAELLARVQGVKPVQGYVITPEHEVLPYLISEFETTYHLTLHAIEEIIAGRQPVHFLTSGCKQSPWFKTCRSLSESCQDLSVLNRVWREEVQFLRDQGIVSIPELAQVDDRTLAKMTSTTTTLERLERLRQQAIAMVEDRIIVNGRVDLPRSSVELFFDIETDPLRDLHYLLGVLVTDDGKETYHPFFAASPAEQPKMFEQFVELIEQYHDAPIYHYGNYERAVTLKMANKFGISLIAQEALERNLIDLLWLMRPAVLFPLPFYSLKDIATYLGYSWKAEDASGANSVLWFDEWLQTQKKSIKEKLLTYNEDDVRATKIVKDWVAKNASV